MLFHLLHIKVVFLHINEKQALCLLSCWHRACSVPLQSGGGVVACRHAEHVPCLVWSSMGRGAVGPVPAHTSAVVCTARAQSVRCSAKPRGEGTWNAKLCKAKAGCTTQRNSFIKITSTGYSRVLGSGTAQSNFRSTAHS